MRVSEEKAWATIHTAPGTLFADGSGRCVFYRCKSSAVLYPHPFTSQQADGVLWERWPGGEL